MNDGGVIFTSYDIRPTAVEFLRDPADGPEAPYTLYCLGLNCAIHLLPTDAVRIAKEILASSQETTP
jgi:hypothetical protein